MTPIAMLLALAGTAYATDAGGADSWEYQGEEVQYLDENYVGGYDFEKVVGGEQVKNDRWDATVGILSGGGVICTGTLIGERVALTAAHCTGGIDGVLIDSDDYLEADMSQVVAVESETAHPDYWSSQWGGNDIAVLRLAERVTKVKPQAVAIECILDRYLEDGAPVHVVGYGSTSESGNGWNTKLNEGATRVQTADCTADEVEGYFTGCDPAIQPGGEIGAGGNGVDACFGDSGGPLYLKTAEGDYLVGVTSRSYAGVPGSQPCKYGGIYTRPDYFIKWIEDTAGFPIKVPSCNEAPEASAEGILTKPGKTGYSIVVASDPDGDAAAITFEIVQPPQFGTVSVDAEGVLAYTANDEAAEGVDSFVVAVTDAGNDAYKRTGDPVTMELEIPVEIKKGLFVTPSGINGGCGCDSADGAVGWLGLVGALGLIRRRR